MVGLERLLIGRTLGGRDAVEELIGRGRGGLVYRARDEEAGAEVALKVLAAPQSAEGRERYRRLVAGEVGLAAAIAHPNVVAVHALGVDPGLDLDFVTFELARGQTLAAVLAQRGKPPIALGLRLLSDAAEGLAAGHRAGLLHRDVRPASLYLVRSEAERQVRVKVGGFGIPQLVRRESLAAAPPEVSAYASPEMLANGSARLTPASDVFGLGVIGFQLMTGELPLGDDARRALAEGRTAEVALPPGPSAAVPPHVFEAVLQALRIAPAERFTDAGAFADALRQPASRPAVAVPATFAAAEAPPAPREAPLVEAAPEAVASPEIEPAREEARPIEALPFAAAVEAASTEAAVAEAASTASADASTGAVDEAPVERPDAVADAAPAGAFVALAGGLLSIDDAPSAAPVESPDAAAVAPAAIQEPAAAPAESPVAAAAPVARASASAAHTHKAPAPRAVPADLELYYPPQLTATPTAVSHPGEAPATPVATQTT
ncbi:MAG TPA: serine/threonine-protein kinase, partial [Longimicrobium sp.]|nr:serine/threonine-protein kinase [Longimicrobium sp.]